MPDDVRELVARCLAGDQAAVTALVDRFQGQVFGLCYRMLGHRQDAEDMAQETLVRAIRSLARWNPERGFLPWLLTIAGNRCRTLLASRARRPSLVAEVDHLADRGAAAEPAGQLAEEVALAVAELRLEYRQAFLMFQRDELSYAEIAAALDCPVGTVKTWVHRARRQIAERLRNRDVLREVPDAVRGL